MPLASVEDLRDLLKTEQAAGASGRLGDKALAVLADMINRPGAAAVESITSLAERNGVDPSTLTRLGKKLGFSGFSDLQAVFRRQVAQDQPFYSSHLQESMAAAGGHLAPKELIHKHAESECQRVLDAAKQLDPRQVERAVDLLVSARHVYVLALRATYGLGYFFGTYLGTLRNDVTILGGPGYALTSDLARLTRNDLLVAMSFRPYTRAVVNAVSVIRETGAPILTLTDSGSPLQVTANHGVTIAIDQPFYFESATAQFFAIQTLLLGAARRLGPAAVEISVRREKLDKALDVEVPLTATEAQARDERRGSPTE